MPQRVMGELPCCTFPPLVIPPPLQSPLPPGGGGGGRHFDISSGNGWLYCALLFFLCKCPLSELISPVIQTQIYATGTVFGTTLAAKLVQPQHAAACRSTFFLELHMGVLKHAAACRSEPKFSHGGLFITCRTCEPFVAHMSQNWMVAQWSMRQRLVWKVLGSIPEKANCLPVSSSLLLHRSSLFLVYWEGIGDHISLSALSVCSHRSVGTHMCRQKHAAACRSMPQHKKFFRGTALACSQQGWPAVGNCHWSLTLWT